MITTSTGAGWTSKTVRQVLADGTAQVEPFNSAFVRLFMKKPGLPASTDPLNRFFQEGSPDYSAASLVPKAVYDEAINPAYDFNVCRVLRDAFFGHNREAVFQAIPDLPEDSFGSCRTLQLIPYAEKFGLIPEGDLVMPTNAHHIRFGVSKEDRPGIGAWMEHPASVKQIYGEYTLKESLVGDCLIIGNRYGCCWFMNFIC